MKEVDEEAGQAADMNEDQCALILIQRKHILDGDCTRLREEARRAHAEAEDAKKNLILVQGRDREAQGRKGADDRSDEECAGSLRIQRALEEISYDDDVPRSKKCASRFSECSRRRGSITKIAGSELGDKLEAIRVRNAESKAQAELADLKRKRRPPLAPMDIFTRSGECLPPTATSSTRTELNMRASSTIRCDARGEFALLGSGCGRDRIQDLRRGHRANTARRRMISTAYRRTAFLARSI